MKLLKCHGNKLQFLRYFATYYYLRSKYFITTPIFYVNAGKDFMTTLYNREQEWDGKHWQILVGDSISIDVDLLVAVGQAPHLGHLHSMVVADAIHRVHKLLGIETTIFSTGTDEHGLKIQQAAKLANQETTQFCDNISKKYKTLCKEVSLSNTHFIRTTDERHKKTVIHFWKELYKRGYIYQGMYEGWYCTSEETFLTESNIKEIIKDGKIQKVSSETNHSVEWMKENNYMFTLSKFQNDLRYWLKRDVIKPKIFADILIKWIEEDLTDLSISREKSRLEWGIPVPDDDSQIIYVWLDALVNYLTVAGYPNFDFHWPADCHVIGKDILRFHGLYWAAFLIAAGLEPPKCILCHSHWTVNNEKMSKSKGNVVNALDIIAKYTSDGVRYFLLREATLPSDANYTEIKMQRVLNAELADNLGNLLSRACASSINKNQVFPQFYPEECPEMGNQLIKAVTLLPDAVKGHFLEGNFYRGIDSILSCLRQANAFMEHQKPWQLAKSTDKKETLDTVLHIILETLKVCGILLQPITPTISNVLLTKLGVSEDKWMWTKLNCFPITDDKEHEQAGKSLKSEKVFLYPRIKI